jgi:hypothetical protein
MAAYHPNGIVNEKAQIATGLPYFRRIPKATTAIRGRELGIVVPKCSMA